MDEVQTDDFQHSALQYALHSDDEESLRPFVNAHCCVCRGRGHERETMEGAIRSLVAYDLLECWFPRLDEVLHQKQSIVCEARSHPDCSRWNAHQHYCVSPSQYVSLLRGANDKKPDFGAASKDERVLGRCSHCEPEIAGYSSEYHE